MQLLEGVVKIALGINDELGTAPSPQQWEAMVGEAVKQGVVGLCFQGIKRLEQLRMMGELEHVVPEQLFYSLAKTAAAIIDRNMAMEQWTEQAVALFQEKGMPCCVLKGQSLARLYGPLRQLRQTGDVDLWVAGGRKRICQMVKTETGRITGLTYHHLHYPMTKDCVLEVHFMPGYMSNPWHNRCLQRFFKTFEPRQGGTVVLPWRFNAVYVLLHAYKHFLGHGLALKQMIDYYFVLQALDDEQQRQTVRQWLKELHLIRFARAMMWVMQEVFEMDSRLLLCEPDDQEGRFLIDEVRATGIEGIMDDRFRQDRRTPLRRFLSNQRYNLHLLSHYPSEVLFSPFFDIYRFTKNTFS